MTDLIHSLETFDQFRDAIDADELYLEASWVTGGLTGGSCWDEGESRYYPVPAEDEPEDEVVDSILEKVCPSLTFLQYRRLTKASIYRYEDTQQNEYYGNSTHYRHRTVDLEVLYRTLRDILA